MATISFDGKYIYGSANIPSDIKEDLPDLNNLEGVNNLIFKYDPKNGIDKLRLTNTANLNQFDFFAKLNTTNGQVSVFKTLSEPRYNIDTNVVEIEIVNMADAENHKEKINSKKDDIFWFRYIEIFNACTPIKPEDFKQYYIILKFDISDGSAAVYTVLEDSVINGDGVTVSIYPFGDTEKTYLKAKEQNAGG